MSDVWKPTVRVEADVLRQACKHGMELWWDGSTPTHRLDQRDGRDGFTRYVNARIEGKVAEHAFSQLLDDYCDVESQVDWRIYGDYEVTDEGDLQYITVDGERRSPQSEFDLKKTKPWNQWLAVRRSIFESHSDNAPFILSKMTIEDDVEVDRWEDADSWDDVTEDEPFQDRFVDFTADVSPVSVEFVGTAYPDEFTDRFDKGDRLYDKPGGYEIGPELRRDNVGIHVSDLVATEDRWENVFSKIVYGDPAAISQQ